MEMEILSGILMCNCSPLMFSSSKSGVNYYLSGRYVPRSLNVDLDPACLDAVRSGMYGRFFSPESFICGQAGAANNWAKGHYTEGAELANETLDFIRKEAESCDLIQGFQIVHSLGGGTGSGMGSLLMEYLKEEYADRIIKSYSIIPTPEVSDTIFGPYNSILTLSHLVDNCDETFCIDNKALYNILTKNLDIAAPTFADMNHLVSYCMAGITCSLRFKGQLNMDLRKLLVNMVPFPKLHFFIPGYAPLMTRNSAPFRSDVVQELTHQIFEAKNMFAFCDPNKGRFFTFGIIFRGLLSPKEVDEEMVKIRTENNSNFMDWMPNSIKIAMCDVPPRGLNISATAISNSTAIQEVFKRLEHSFSLMFRKKAYLHWYTGEGMYETEFVDAQNIMKDLIFEYQQYQEGDSEVENIEQETDDTDYGSDTGGIGNTQII
ncbi:tubulin beta chain-like isoform X2 [Belonocnema kinseyi]|uniref:tubulin beta chain-like isoform X2 n=1 Tax=Belonocnema kinseyi TaxID=2817044 RepID=UPI00143DAFDA|nr:tubulin beta chain-like isoform X2 [Belonocnema kinseyi]